MAYYILCGVRNISISQAKVEIEKALGFCFEERESSYQGGLYYVFGASASEHFVLKYNLDPFDAEPVEQDFPGFPILLYINATERPSELVSAISSASGFELLRHELL